MCYIFKSLKANRLLNPGDTIALGDADLHAVSRDAAPRGLRPAQDRPIQARAGTALPVHRRRTSNKLLDPKIKAFFVVNPGNPCAVALSRESIAAIGAILEKRPDLMLLTDDVYGTFVPGFRSLLGEFPAQHDRRLFLQQVFRLHRLAPRRHRPAREQHVRRRRSPTHPGSRSETLDKRYAPLTLEPRKLKFIDRIVADSRDIALNHTAGLSLPQQVMMTLFSLSELMDEKKEYQKACIEHRAEAGRATIEGLGIEIDAESDSSTTTTA